MRILVAKGTTAPRAAYEPIAAKRIVEVNSGGATDVNPKRFTFKNIRRPLFGVDEQGYRGNGRPAAAKAA